MQLDAELTLNALEIQGGNVTIDITGPRQVEVCRIFISCFFSLSGPQDRWFAIGWNASFMAGAYTTVVSLNNPAIKAPQNYDSIVDKGVLDADQGHRTEDKITLNMLFSF